MSVRHGELTLQVLMYIAGLIAEQKYEEVLQLGLRRDQADVIRAMTTEEIYRMALRIRTDFLSIRVDPDAFDRAVSVLKRHQEDEELDRTLILAGARYEMMHRLCGMSTQDYAKYRRDLNLSEGRGRPPMPPEAVQVLIWRAWLESAEETNEKRRYLAVQAKVHVPVGTIWKLICEWESTRITPIFAASLPKGSAAGDNKNAFATTE
ncbi:MAG: DUF2857 domain-containing protein [Methylococcaceae bacterium]|nr:DUF2857 domain-containing protein [Methylococcaceae bacterium]